MVQLLKIKEHIYRFIGKYEIYAMAVFRFLVAFLAFSLINHQIGYMDILKEYPIALLCALLCSFLPSGMMLFFGALLILLNCYALSLELCGIVALIFVALFCIYYRFTSKKGIYTVLTSVLGIAGIPYVMPVAAGILDRIYTVVAVVCGEFVYFLLKSVNQNAALFSAKETITKKSVVTLAVTQIFTDKEMYFYLAAFAAAAVIVSCVRRLSVDHARTIAIVLGIAVQLGVICSGEIYLGETGRIVRVILGCMVSLVIALVLAVVMAYLPVTFIGWTELDASGNEVSYTGLKAIRKRQEQQVSDTITPDVMQEALEAYQRVYRQYDASSINDIPVEVFYKELARYQPLVNNAKEAFADPKTGMAPGVMGLTAEDMQNFYSQLPKRLESVIWLEQSGKPGYEQAQAIAQKKFDAVQKPFTYSFGVSSDAMDYQTLLNLLLTLLCAVIAAPVFASDAQTGAQDIQLCTKNGGLRLAAAKLAAAFSITGAAYLLCGVVWILVTNALFGWESTQTSVQWLFSVTSLLPYTVGQMEWVMLVANFLIFFAEVAFVLMASVWAKNNLTALSVALISVVAPLIVYMVVPGSFGEWLSTLLPAGGIGLSNALMYKMISFDFLYAGGHAFFQADVLLASAPVKIVLLVGLAAWGYLRKTKVA